MWGRQTLLTDSRLALPPEWELWQAMKAQAQPVWSPWHLPKLVYERNLPQLLWAPHERVFHSSTGGAPVHALDSFKFCSRWVHVGQVLRVEGTMSGIVGDGGTFGAALKPMAWRFSIESSWAAPFGRTKPVVSQVVGGQTDSSPPLNEAHCAAHQTFPRALCPKASLVWHRLW